MTEVKTYCDRCGKNISYSFRKNYKAGRYDLCDACYEEFRSWLKGREVKADE
jgi:hypothetical protein